MSRISILSPLQELSFPILDPYGVGCRKFEENYKEDSLLMRKWTQKFQQNFLFGSTIFKTQLT